MDHRAELGEFLRAHRDAVTPERVGLPPGASRRVACQLPVPGDDSAERLAVRHYLV